MSDGRRQTESLQPNSTGYWILAFIQYDLREPASDICFCTNGFQVEAWARQSPF